MSRRHASLFGQPIWRLVFGAGLVSFAPVLVRATSVPPTTSAFYRMFLGGLALALIVLVGRARKFPGNRVVLGLTLAGFAFAFDLFFWHRSIHIVGPGLATLLAGFQVFVMALAGLLFFGERLRWQLVLAVPAAFLGITLIIGFDWGGLDQTYRLGVYFGLATALCYSTVLLLMRWTQANAVNRGFPIIEVAIMSLACAAMLLAVALINDESLAIPDVREAGLLIAYATVAQVGWVVIVSGLNKVPVALAGLVLLMEPTLAYVWDIVIFSRATTALQALGALLAISAIYLGSSTQE